MLWKGKQLIKMSAGWWDSSTVEAFSIRHKVGTAQFDPSICFGSIGSDELRIMATIGATASSLTQPSKPDPESDLTLYPKLEIAISTLALTPVPKRGKSCMKTRRTLTPRTST